MTYECFIVIVTEITTVHSTTCNEGSETSYPLPKIVFCKFNILRCTPSPVKNVKTPCLLVTRVVVYVTWFNLFLYAIRNA